MAVRAESREIRRYRRFTGWNYAKGASLFITMATAPRRPLFGSIQGGSVALAPFGEKVAEALQAIPRLNPGFRLFGWVVMPDHIHFNCALAPGLDEPLKVLGGAIRRFKNYTTALAKRSLGLAERSSAIKSVAAGSRDSNRLDGRDIFDGQTSFVAQTSFDGQTIFDGKTSFDGQTAFGQPTTIWQQGYHDYILLSRSMIDSTERYIAYNPMKWELMYCEGGALRVVEPLSSPRLDIGDYWKGVGNIALLSTDEKLVSLRVSREVATPEAIARVVRRMESAVEKGYVIISGFISKGEQAVRDMLCRRGDARFIRILPSCIPNRRFRPESRYVEPFAEDRYLEIARGNDETEFGRRACLDLNAEIVEIATAGEGLALYWKVNGPQVIARSDA